MDLKELMGDAYKDDITKEDVEAFFKKQVLASGDYTNSGKAKAEQKQLNDKIADLQAQLDAKMTDDDKKKKAEADAKKLIENLEQQLKERNLSLSKKTAISSLADAKIKAGIKDDDKEYDEFLTGISFEEDEKTEKISKYISKIVSSAYEAGKSEAIKNKLGKMGSFKDGQDGDGNRDDKGSFGKQLAQSVKVQQPETKNFFERK